MKTIIIFLGLTCLLCVHTNAQSPDHQLGRGKSTPSYHLGKSKSAQKSDDFFKTHSDYIIENNGSLESLTPRVYHILKELGVIPR